jgi:hypothetical protein
MPALPERSRGRVKEVSMSFAIVIQGDVQHGLWQDAR